MLVRVLILTILYFSVYGTHLYETLNVRQISSKGFGDINNTYAWSMAVFNGSIYVGTLNEIDPANSNNLFVFGKPFPTEGAQIYKGDIIRRNNEYEYEWTKVLKDGNGDINTFGVRKLLKVGNYLYGVTGNYISGFSLFATNDGLNWKTIINDGFNDSDNLSGRGLIVYKNYFYIGVENRVNGAKMFRRGINNNGSFIENSKWEEIINNGLGYKTNHWFADFVIYLGYLYVGTLNNIDGFQLWRTMDGKTWNNILYGGGDNNIISNGTLNWAVLDLIVYNDKLYLGTLNSFEGAQLWVNTDDDGLIFEPVFINGNGNIHNAYIWQLCVYNDRLYVGTLNLNGFMIYSSNNPMNDTEWVIETNDGFGINGEDGVRTMVVYNESLIIGSATGAVNTGCIIFQGTQLF